MDADTENLDIIPHRPPFRLLDRIEAITPDRVVARYTPRAEDPLWRLVYAGHYPSAPVTPGVLLCEMVFQAGAALMAHRLGGIAPDTAAPEKIPVIARILSAKFRLRVAPGDALRIEVAFVERMADAFVLKGTLSTDAQEALRVEFMVALTEA